MRLIVRPYVGLKCIKLIQKFPVVVVPLFAGCHGMPSRHTNDNLVPEGIRFLRTLRSHFGEIVKIWTIENLFQNACYWFLISHRNQIFEMFVQPEPSLGDNRNGEVTVDWFWVILPSCHFTLPYRRAIAICLESYSERSCWHLLICCWKWLFLLSGKKI